MSQNVDHGYGKIPLTWAVGDRCRYRGEDYTVVYIGEEGIACYIESSPRVGRIVLLKELEMRWVS